MGTDYFQIWDEYEEAERMSFIVSEMENLKQMASLYDVTDSLDWTDIN